MNSQKQLEVKLSKLKSIENPLANLEQYETSSNIGASVLWNAYMNKDIEDKVIADLGCGNGILGIGSLLLGAKKVFFLDSDNSSLIITKENLNNLDLNNSVLLKQEVQSFNEQVDLVIQNPPFGVQNEHADKPFLEKAMESSKKIYSIHKIESKNFINSLAQEHRFKLLNIIEYNLKLKKTQKFHTKKYHQVKIGCFILEHI